MTLDEKNSQEDPLSEAPVSFLDQETVERWSEDRKERPPRLPSPSPAVVVCIWDTCYGVKVSSVLTQKSKSSSKYPRTEFQVFPHTFARPDIKAHTRSCSRGSWTPPFTVEGCGNKLSVLCVVGYLFDVPQETSSFTGGHQSGSGICGGPMCHKRPPLLPGNTNPGQAFVEVRRVTRDLLFHRGHQSGLKGLDKNLHLGKEPPLGLVQTF